MDEERLRMLLPQELEAADQLYTLAKRKNDRELEISSGRWLVHHLLDKKLLVLKHGNLGSLPFISENKKRAIPIIRHLISIGCPAKWCLVTNNSERILPIILDANERLKPHWMIDGASHIHTAILKSDGIRYLDLDGIYIPCSWNHESDPNRLLSLCMSIPGLYQKSPVPMFISQIQRLVHMSAYRSYFEPQISYIHTSFIGRSTDNSPVTFDMDSFRSVPRTISHTESDEYARITRQIEDFVISMYLGDNLKERYPNLEPVSTEEWCAKYVAWLGTFGYLIKIMG
jgi:hypothetical protein